MHSNNIFHYPPELFDLIISTVPLLNKSKEGVLDFFRGAGVSDDILNKFREKIKFNKESVNKYQLTREILKAINIDSDKYLRERREVLKRITEFETFTNCWPDDILKAKGLVAEIRDVIKVKDYFTRMQEAKEEEHKKSKIEYEKKCQAIQKKEQELDALKKQFYALFSEKNPIERGHKLEKALNDIFEKHEILVRESFKRSGEKGEGIIEQIDGVIEIDNEIYLVEMKWHKETIGVNYIYSHLGRIFSRPHAKGIFISASGFSSSAIQAAKESMLQHALLILTDLEEFVKILDKREDVKNYFKQKIRNAIIDKNPYFKPLI